jgi:hypothetical protein
VVLSGNKLPGKIINRIASNPGKRPPAVFALLRSPNRLVSDGPANQRCAVEVGAVSPLRCPK